MIRNSTQRSILRWMHLIASIPILGYIYSPFKEIPNYASSVRFVFVPAIVLSGFWMYSGIIFAILGVAVWMGAYFLLGLPAAVLSQVGLFIARKIWLVVRRRTAKSPELSAGDNRKLVDIQENQPD
jgi:hypothetical protein